MTRLAFTLMIAWTLALRGEPGNVRNTTPPLLERDIVFIVTDDQAWHEIEQMPRTKALIGDPGVRFTRAFVSSPLCCPSRATILTGLYAHHHGVHGNGRPNGGVSAFDHRSTVATWLSGAGYRTGIFGKYLNNYERLMAPRIAPGWSRWFVFDTDIAYYDWKAVDDATVVTFSGRDSASYATKVIADRAVQFIETTPAGQRLFLYFAPSAPHGPYLPQVEDQGSFASAAPLRPPNFNESDVSDKPAWVRALPILQANKMDRNYRRQLESLQAVDRAVAAIFDAIQRTGRLQNTMFIFISDNGFSLGSHRWDTKQCVYEECARVPLLIRAPLVLPRTDDHLVSNVDFAPSIAEWAGISPPAPVDGRSLVPLLLVPLVIVPWRDALLLEMIADAGGVVVPGYSAVRTDRWKYVELDTAERELYDLQNDPYELQNRAGDAAYAGVRDSLAVVLDGMR